MARVEYKNDQTRAIEEAEGTDGRLNVSSRADSRAYYNSRDREQTYSVIVDHQGAVAGEFSAYWKNLSNTKTLVISSVAVNSAENSRIKIHFVTGDVAGGATVTPTNLNNPSSNAADSQSKEGVSGDALTGLTSKSVVDCVFVLANGHGELALADRVRLGQNDAIALEYDEGTTGDFVATIYGYFE